MIAALALILFASAAPAARLHGTVRVPGGSHDDPAFHPYAGHASSMAGHVMSVRGAVVDAVIYLESVPASVDSSVPVPATHPKLAQKDQSFVPRVVVVPVGGIVDFPNMDPIYHNVFSVSPVKRFDLGKYPRGESRSVRFPKAGLVNVYCDIHSDMAAFILVVPNRAFARPHADGAWELPDVPPGHYVLCWWHPDLSGGRREIEVGDREPAAVDVSF
jgi:plastocyanin